METQSTDGIYGIQTYDNKLMQSVRNGKIQSNSLQVEFGINLEGEIKCKKGKADKRTTPVEEKKKTNHNKHRNCNTHPKDNKWIHLRKPCERHKAWGWVMVIPGEGGASMFLNM